MGWGHRRGWGYDRGFLPSAEQLYEYCNVGDTSYESVESSDFMAQTFTPQKTHDITLVKIKAFREGSPGEVLISIRATDGDGFPTGYDLSFGTFDGDTITEDEGGEWIEIIMNIYKLEASTKYAIVMSAADGDYSNILHPRYKEPGDYDRGDALYSVDSGVTWDYLIGADPDDFMFEEWGV